MKIELKNLKVNETLSEETTCYSATIYVNGKRAFMASNRGHGGCDNYYPVQGYNGPSEQEINAWLKANKKPLETEGITLEYDLELFVGDLIEETLAARRLQKLLRTKIVVLDRGQLYTYKLKPTPENLRAAQTKVKGQIVNNNPELEALALKMV